MNYIVIDTEVLIDQLEDGVIYHCYNERRIDFICPCGCGKIIILSTLEDSKPCWKITGNSITPSINRLVGCRLHFTITNGIVNIC